MLVRQIDRLENLGDGEGGGAHEGVDLVAQSIPGRLKGRGVKGGEGAGGESKRGRGVEGERGWTGTHLI